MFRTILVTGLMVLAIGGTAPALAAGEQQPVGSAEERTAYQERVQSQIEAWRTKIEQFAQTASERSATAGGQANARLNAAWQDVNEEWQELKAAAQQEWAEARQEMDEALQELQQAWEAREPAGSAPQARQDDSLPFFYAIDMATRMTA